MADAVLPALAPVFFVMAIGYGAGRLRVINGTQIEGLNALVMDFALPASLFLATASASRSQMLEQVPLFAVLGVVMLLLYFGWYFLARTSYKVSRADASLQALTIAFPNLAGVGLPVMYAVIGPRGTVPVAVALAAGSILVSPLTLVMAELSKTGGAASETPLARVVSALRRALMKPVVLAPALGMLLSLAGLRLGAIADACLMLIGQAASGVALFLTGLILSAQSFRLDWRVAGATGMADVVRPLLTAAVVFSLPIPPDAAKTAVLLGALPSGFFGVLFAVDYRLDSATAGSMVIASTGLSIVTIAIAIAVLFAS